MNILITGGAGFIGQHTAEMLIKKKHKVFLIDNLSEQIHGIRSKVDITKFFGKLYEGDIRDKNILDRVFRENKIDVIYHFAAETGTGQSMYSITDYSDVNIQGTAILLNYLSDNNLVKTIKKFIVASSRAIYGEGEYECHTHGKVYPSARAENDLIAGVFENKCPICNSNIKLLNTTEQTPFNPLSIYGLTKQVQEQMVLMFCSNSNIQAYALRYQNVYGPGQSLLNPYTGILAVFSNLARNGHEINVFEDGFESRDFVYIDDVVNANILCLEDDSYFSGAVNIGTGISTPVINVAKTINEFFGNNSNVVISGLYRVGDIRHNKADINKASEKLNFKPLVEFETGINSFLNWAQMQELPRDYGFKKSLSELSAKGLIKKK